MLSFSENVRNVVRAITPGTVMTYGSVAKAAGKPTAHRAVARIMSSNFDPTVPCHRVVKSDGTLGGYNRGGIVQKQKILSKEGVQFTASNKVIF